MYPFFINWQSYFKNEQEIDYNLKNTLNIKLYNTNDFTMPGEYQINNLNPYIGELVMMYYVWKHNLKSEYICISQYRKNFAYIDFDKLKNDYIQVWNYWETPNFEGDSIPINLITSDGCRLDPIDFWKQKLTEYLHKQSIYDETIVNKILYGENTKYMSALVFAMKWNIFCKLCEFIFGFLDYVFPNDQWKDIEAIESLRLSMYDEYCKKYGDHGEWIFVKNKRYIVFVIERILMVCLSSMHNIFHGQVYISQNIITSSNNFISIAEFYKRNKKINTQYIYCKVPDKNYDELNNFFNKNNYEYPNLKIINESIEIKEDLIELDINEYIDIDDIYKLNNMTTMQIKKYVKTL
jgi:hypothetical protein